MRVGWMFGCLVCVACGDDSGGDDGGDDDDDSLAIAGSYVDEFGGEHEISEAEWVQTYAGSSESYVFHVVGWDNDAERLVAHNAPENPYNGNQFSTFDWLDDGDLYVCQTRFDAASQDDAEAASRPDDSDPTANTCGGFPWTNLTP